MDKATLVVEYKTQGVSQATQQLRAFESTAARAEGTTQRGTKATALFGQGASRAGGALQTGLGGPMQRILGMFGGGGGGGGLTGMLTKGISGFGGLGAAIGAAGAAMLVMVGIKIIKFLNDASEAALKFNEALGEIETLIPGQVQKLEDYTDAIQRLSVEMNKSQSDLAKATYQVISAFGDQSNAMDILEVSAMAASAGLATTLDAVNLLSAVSKGYGDTSTEMIKKISDLAFMTVKLGQTTFPELAASIGQAVPIANALGVSVEELFAVEATLTGVTGGAAEVTTQLRSAMVAMLKPIKELSSLFEKYGAKDGPEFIAATGGIVGALQVIQDEATASGRSMTDFLPRVEGITAALALTGAQADVFKSKFAQLQEASGATEMAFEAFSEGVNRYGFIIGQFRQRMDILKTNLGQMILPIKAVLLEGISPLVEGISNLFRFLGKVARAIETFTRPLRAIMTLPIRASVAIMREVFAKLGDVVDWLTRFFEALYKKVKEKVQPILERLGVVVQNVRDWFAALWDRVTDMFPAMDDLGGKFEATRIAGILLQGVIFGIGTAFDIIVFSIRTTIDAFGTLVRASAAMGELLKDIFTGRWGQVGADARAIVDTFRTGGLNIKDNWEGMIASIRGRWGEFREEFLYDMTNLTGALATGADNAGRAALSATKTWREWFTEITGVENILTGAEGAERYIQSLMRLTEVGERVSSLLGKDFDLTKSLQAQASEIEKTLQALFQIDPSLIDLPFTKQDAAIKALITRYQELQVEIEGLADSERSLVEQYQEQLDQIDQLGVVYHQLGIEYDVSKQKSELVRSAIERLGKDADITTEELNAFVATFGALIEIEDTGKLTIDQIIVAFEKEVDTIDRLGVVYDQLGIEYDVSAQKSELVRSAIERLGKDVDISTEGLNAFVEVFRSLIEIDTGRLKIDQIIVAFEKQVDIIDRMALVYRQLGIEYDATTEKQSLFQSELQTLLETVDITDDEIQTFIERFGNLNVAVEKTDTALTILTSHLSEMFSIAKEDAQKLAETLLSVKDALINLGFNAALDSVKEFGKALGEGANFGEAMAAGIRTFAQAVLNALPQLLLAVGTALLQIPGLWPLGLGFILASGIVSGIGGYVEGATAETTTNALGNVYNNGRVQPYGAGGVVDRPTVFPMASGGIGMMGESGSEAILPLDRLPDGSLGVRATGGGQSVQLNVKIENYSNEAVDVQTDPSTGDLTVVIGNAMRQVFQKGDMDGTMRSKYGLRKQGVQ